MRISVSQFTSDMFQWIDKSWKIEIYIQYIPCQSLWQYWLLRKNFLHTPSIIPLFLLLQSIKRTNYVELYIIVRLKSHPHPLLSFFPFINEWGEKIEKSVNLLTLHQVICTNYTSYWDFNPPPSFLFSFINKWEKTESN